MSFPTKHWNKRSPMDLSPVLLPGKYFFQEDSSMIFYTSKLIGSFL